MANGRNTRLDRNFGLDLLRAIAISMVLFTHGSIFLQSNNYFVFGFLPIFGFLGVELFFGLSGYLIGSILLGSNQKISKFYLHRFFKILPPYLLLLLILVIIFHPDVSTFLAHLLFIQNFQAGYAGFFPVSWSLSIEFWFYILIPLVLVGRMSTSRPNLLRRMLILILLVCIARTIYILLFRPGWEFGLHRFIPFRFDTLMLGVIAAEIKYNYRKIFNYLISRLFFYACVAILLVSMAIFSSAYYFSKLDNAIMFQVLLFPIIAATIMVIVLYVESKFSGVSVNNYFGRMVSFLSRISYSLYLIHFFVFYYVEKLSLAPLAGYLLAVVISVVLSSFFYWQVEVRILKTRRRIEAKIE